MRMAADELLGQGLDHVGKIENPCSCAMRAWKTTCSRRSPSSSTQVVEIAPGDSVGDLIGFLERIGRDGLEVLLQVPRAAAAGRAQRRHDLDEPGKVAGWSHVKSRLDDEAKATTPPQGALTDLTGVHDFSSALKTSMAGRGGPAIAQNRGSALVPRSIRLAARFEQEPATLLGLVDEDLEQARGRHVLVIIDQLVASRMFSMWTCCLISSCSMSNGGTKSALLSLTAAAPR